MESTTLSSSTSHDDQHPHPVDHVSQSAAEDSFGFEHLQINAYDGSHTQQLMPESAEIDDEDQEEEYDDDDEAEAEEGDFTFMCIGDNDSAITEDVEGGQIRPVFPLFDQTLLSGSEYDEGRRRLPISAQVDKVFIESPRLSPSSGNEETDGMATGTFCSLSKESDNGTKEMNLKSNSTGFSKLWRFRDKMNRSNSDGRDAFVFLDGPDRTTTSESKADAVDRSNVKVNAAGKEKVVKKVSKAKKGTASAHEVYLKQKVGQTEERRRSYLPYRPGVMGFFTNVNGGLSKNVDCFCLEAMIKFRDNRWLCEEAKKLPLLV
ncbi:uncharacterized protein LOC111910630 [Lactuca sativa]|uniref:Uncharacterized protein n=1 Tax=Lactuca sativa TaxID=4236 RepID=A0A9R1XLR4_LACSA|nr:uncharacterized protein LOC111910630 [Lactuca sativa]KAJ0214429.1 hypothetical protein LSAT_V11C400159500 [Lactuca sativa]